MEYLIDKIYAAVKDMSDKVRFVNIDENGDEAHNYLRVSDNKYLAGCTEISGSVGDILKIDILKRWTAKEAVNFLEDKQEEIKKMSSEDYSKLLYEAKIAWTKKTKQALLDGKSGHDWLEDYVKAKIIKSELPEIPQDNLKRPIEQFLNWEKDNIKQWVLSEALVADVENEYAGRLDALAILKDDRLAVIDFKFANQLSPDYGLQTAGYANCFMRYDIPIQARIVIRLPKTETIKVYDKKSRTYSEEENNLEVEEIKAPLDFDLKVFLAARFIEKWINLHKNK